MGSVDCHKSSTIPDLLIIHPRVFYDFRGEFVETFSTLSYQFADAQGKAITFVEDDISLSKRNVMRGLHGSPNTCKLVQCLHGEVYCVIVDMRDNSPSLYKWESITLNDRNRTQLLVPAGCATGILCMSDSCLFGYKQSQHYIDAQHQFTVRWNDPKLKIYWPVREPIVSERDSTAVLLP